MFGTKSHEPSDWLADNVAKSDIAVFLLWLVSVHVLFVSAHCGRSCSVRPAMLPILLVKDRVTTEARSLWVYFKFPT